MASLPTMLCTLLMCLSLFVASAWTDSPGSCTFEAGQNVTYWHMSFNAQMSEGETVANGTQIRVRCPDTGTDYSDNYDYNGNTINDENVSEPYIECVDGNFTKHELGCEKETKSPPESSPSPSKCTEIANGQITDRGKSFICNTDYHPAFKNGMDAVLYTRYSCTCNQTSGRLQCMGTEVECKPIECPADYCNFGGHCIRDHECQCPEQTSGKQCQTPLCKPGCQNGGTCLFPNTCQCPGGYNGTRCENEADSEEMQASLKAYRTLFNHIKQPVEYKKNMTRFFDWLLAKFVFPNNNTYV